MAKWSLGQPSQDALETASLLQQRLVEEEASELQNTVQMIHETSSRANLDVTKSMRDLSVSVIATGAHTKKQSAVVKRDIQNIMDRFAISDQRGVAVGRTARLPPETRGWTPTGTRTRDWRSPTRALSPTLGINSLDTSLSDEEQPAADV